jgi:hypothetical protein
MEEPLPRRPLRRAVPPDKTDRCRPKNTVPRLSQPFPGGVVFTPCNGGPSFSSFS